MSRKKTRKKQKTHPRKRKTRREIKSTNLSVDVDARLRKALQYHQAGQLQNAQALYRKILQVRPDHPVPAYLLGVIAYQAGNHDQAVQFFSKAAESDPHNPDYFVSLGNAFQDQAKLDEAISCYKKAVKLKSDLIGPYYDMGVAFQDQRKLDEAIACYKKVVQLKPNMAGAYNNMGVAFQDQGNLDEAISCFQKTVQLKPDHAEALNNLGKAFQNQGLLDEAISFFQKALEVKPDLAKALNNLGIVLREKGEIEEAISCWRKAISIQPDYAEVHLNMGNMFLQLGKLDDAIFCFQKRVELKPECAEALVGLGRAFQIQGRVDEAASCWHKALLIKPDPGTRINMAFLQPVIYESVEAIEKSRRRIYEQMESLEHNGLTIEDPLRQVGQTNFFFAYHGVDDKDLQKKIALFYMKVCPRLAWTPGNACKPRREYDKIRIGFISKHLHSHTIGNLNLGIIRNLSRDKFRVKLFRFFGPEDHMSRAIDRAADEVIVLPDHLKSARRKIADHPVDILFYPDVGMDPLTYFLAFSRLAPLQCVTWGHPVTTGIPSIDYYLSFENSEPPDANDHYSEQLVLLKRFVMYCFRPQLPKAPRFRSDFDLPEGCNLYVCPQMLFKFHPDFDKILRDILRQDPNGLIILSEGVCRNWTALLSKRFAQAFPQDIDRVKFLPYLPFNDFLSLLQMADVMLDTIHFNGGFTSILAFACGLPIITLPGRFMRGRLTLAMYKQMGIMDCVAEDAESYVKIALRLTNERKWREEIVKKISTRCDVLLEDMEAVRELERFFERAVSSA